MQKIRFGMIGSNFITESFIKGLVKEERAELTAVYSRTQERADEVAKAHNVPYTFTDLEEMAKSDVIDAVYIASPNALHPSQAILCMTHKKHVLCEKAFAATVDEVDAMIQVSEDNQVILMEAIRSLHVPNFATIEQEVGRVGKVRKYFSSFCQYSSRYDAYRSGTVLNAFKPELANGALVDIGVYCIAPMVRLFGKPESIQASGYMLESGVDGEGSIVFKYPEMTAMIQYSKISNSSLPTEIQGEDGTIEIEKISQVGQVTFKTRKGEAVILGEGGHPDDLYDETHDFVSLVLDNNRVQASKWLEESRIVVEIMQEARKQIGIIYPGEA